MTKSYSPEAMAVADAILKAGSNLKNDTTPYSRDVLLRAAQQAIDNTRAELITALHNLWLDAPFPNWAFYGPQKDALGDSDNLRQKYINSRSEAEKALRKAGAK